MQFCLSNKKIQPCGLNGWSNFYVADIITSIATDTKASQVKYVLLSFRSGYHGRRLVPSEVQGETRKNESCKHDDRLLEVFNPSIAIDT